MATNACAMCGVTLTFWNRASGQNLCTRCASGKSPEALRREAETLLDLEPNLTAQNVLNYPWKEIVGTLITHTAIYLACVWAGAYLGGWLLGMVGGFVGMYFVMRGAKQTVNVIDRGRIQMHNGVMIAVFWLIFFINYFRVLMDVIGRDYGGSNVFFDIWLLPTIAAPIVGLAVAWLTDKGRLTRMADAIQKFNRSAKRK